MFKTSIAMLAVFGGLAVSAQGIQRGRPVQNRPRFQSALDMSRVQTIEGTVSAVNIAAGHQYPSIEIAGNVVRVAPAWHLLEAGFELKSGDAIRLRAAPATAASGVYLHAIEILNLATNEKVVLRDASGFPAWAGVQGGRTAMRSGACLDPASTATVTGVVDQVNAGAGIQMPGLTVRTADGSMVTIRIGPERILLAADFELQAGQTVSVRYAVCTVTGDRVALAITNAAGVTLVLREDDGTPAW